MQIIRRENLHLLQYGCLCARCFCFVIEVCILFASVNTMYLVFTADRGNLSVFCDRYIWIHTPFLCNIVCIFICCKIFLVCRKIQYTHYVTPVQRPEEFKNINHVWNKHFYYRNFVLDTVLMIVRCCYIVGCIWHEAQWNSPIHVQKSIYWQKILK
jgi:hypothetical protein